MAFQGFRGVSREKAHRRVVLLFRLGGGALLFVGGSTGPFALALQIGRVGDRNPTNGIAEIGGGQQALVVERARTDLHYIQPFRSSSGALLAQQATQRLARHARLQFGFHEGEHVEKMSFEHLGFPVSVVAELEGFEDDGVQLWRHVRCDLGGRDSRSVANGFHGLHVRLPAEQTSLSEALPKRNRDREDVGSSVRRLANEALRCRVGQLACRAFGIVALRRVILVGSETSQLHVASLGEEDAGRCDVPVDDRGPLGLGAVREAQDVQNLDGDISGHPGGDAESRLGRRAQELVQINAVDVLQGHVVLASVRLPQLQNLDCVGMAELSGDPRLVDEGVHVKRVIGQMRKQAFDDHVLRAICIGGHFGKIRFSRAVEVEAGQELELPESTRKPEFWRVVGHPERDVIPNPGFCQLCGRREKKPCTSSRRLG